MGEWKSSYVQQTQEASKQWCWTHPEEGHHFSHGANKNEASTTHA